MLALVDLYLGVLNDFRGFFGGLIILQASLVLKGAFMGGGKEERRQEKPRCT